MFVLGIDPGLTRTGYGVVEKSRGGLKAVAVGVIHTDKDSRIADRLLELHHDLSGIVAEYAIDTAAIEQVFVNQNRMTATGVVRASGVALLALAQAGLQVVEYTPSAIKMALTGFGAADKDQVQRVVQMRLGLESVPRPADAADALAVAICHIQASGLQHRLQQSGVTS